MSLQNKKPRLPTLKYDGLPPKVYYRVAEAAEILGTTPDTVIHYGATGRLELVIPIPKGYLALATDTTTQETAGPLIATELYVLETHSCRDIEFYGHATVSSFSACYDLFTELRPCRWDTSQSDFRNYVSAKPRSNWALMVSGSAGETAIKIDSSCLFIICEELNRFKASAKKEQTETEIDKQRRQPIDNSNKSDKLAVLNQGFWIHWANAKRDERSTQPDSAKVVAWFEDRGFSFSMAKKAASIIRPDWAAIGRPKEE